MKKWCSAEWRYKNTHWGFKSELSCPHQWAGVICPQEGREGGGGKKQSSIPFSSSPMTFFSFLLLYSSPRVLSLLPHPFPFAHDSCREVSSNQPQLLSLQMSFCQLPKDFADHCMGDPTNSINVFILKKRCTFNWKPCFSFVCIFCKKEKETTNWKRKKKENLFPCVLEHTYVCLCSKMTVLVRNRCKQGRSGKSLPGKSEGSGTYCWFWFSDWPSWPTGSMGREGRKKNKMKLGKNSQELANSDRKQVSGLNWMQCGPF